MKYYKGFNKDMTCRGFQFEEGKTYETNTAKLCESGFHACEAPLGCLVYYAPATSEYHEVELEDISPERSGGDTKVCAKKIKIGAKLDIEGIVKAQIEYVKEHCTNSETGGNGSALNGGYGSALNGRDRSALNGGDRSALNGGNGSALNGGNRSALNGGNGSALNGGNRSCLRGSCGARFKGGMHTVFAAEDWRNGSFVGMKTTFVDGERIKPDTWYKLENGEFVEASDNDK